MQHTPAAERFLAGGARFDAFAVRCLHLVLACCCLFLAACLETRLPDGVLATVNGTPITLRSVQALLDSHSASLGTKRSPSLENMKREYGEALGTLIIYELVQQELQRRQMAVSEASLDAAINDIKKDYGGGDGLEQYLTEESLDPREWRALMRDHLSMVSFEKRVLTSGIKVSIDEVRAYYAAHEKDFQMPETLRVCLASGESRQDVEAFCADVAKRPADGSTVKLQCLSTGAGDLPQSWRKPAESLKEGQCAPVRREDGVWRSVALFERTPATRMGLADAYPLVESILREQKMSAAFEAWLAEALASSDIKVAHDLAPDLLAPPSTRPAVQDDGDAGQDQGDTDAPLPPKDEPYQGDTFESGVQRSGDSVGSSKSAPAGEVKNSGSKISGARNGNGRNGKHDAPHQR